MCMNSTPVLYVCEKRIFKKIHVHVYIFWGKCITSVFCIKWHIFYERAFRSTHWFSSLTRWTTNTLNGFGSGSGFSDFEIRWSFVWNACQWYILFCDRGSFYANKICWTKLTLICCLFKLWNVFCLFRMWLVKISG